MPDSRFELRVRMKNASSDVAASNIMFTFASEEVENTPIFTSESGSTSVVVNNMAPGATADLDGVQRRRRRRRQKSYRMTIQERYDSPEFKMPRKKSNCPPGQAGAAAELPARSM